MTAVASSLDALSQLRPTVFISTLELLLVTSAEKWRVELHATRPSISLTKYFMEESHQNSVVSQGIDSFLSSTFFLDIPMEDVRKHLWKKQLQPQRSP